MKLISFDVGIKNMAYCILEIQGSQININNWGILNLMDDENISYECDCKNKPKNKKTPPSNCGKKAKYSKNNKYYCEKHAKECSQYMISTKEMKPAYLKKLKLNELIQQGHQNLIFINVENILKMKKQEVLEIMIKYYETQCFDVIQNKKRRTAGETDLISVGKRMKEQLNNIDNIQDIKYAIIENQISPIATRMKTVQGMLAQYFIMLNEDIDIEFVSSSHKLKQFSELKIDEREHCTGQVNNNIVQTNPDYKKHKKDGVYYCSRMIEINDSFKSWQDTLNTKKKDDLADSFLQGIWYLKHKNIIMFAEDLKINIV